MTELELTIILTPILTKILTIMLTELQRYMLDAEEAEVSDLVCSLHLSENYMNNWGREEAVERFWSNRDGK
jgi:hypothetical protein